MTSDKPTDTGTPYRAQKIGGSYQAKGTVVSEFENLDGERRCVFAFDEPRGMLHIFNLGQISRLAETDTAALPLNPTGAGSDLVRELRKSAQELGQRTSEWVENHLAIPGDGPALDAAELMRRAADFIESQPSGECKSDPPGGKWKLVPTEPTREMERAGDKLIGRHGDMTRSLGVYLAMLAASPLSPAERTTESSGQSEGELNRSDATTDDNNLMPCPFCGGEAERIDIETGDNVGGSCIGCKQCGASGAVEFGFKENFISNWNRRLRPAQGGREILTSKSWAWRMAAMLRFIKAQHPDLVTKIDALLEGPSAVEQAELDRALTPSHPPSDLERMRGALECRGLDNDKQVFFYEQDFYVLSNFSSFSLNTENGKFPTSEHAYHYEKFLGPLGKDLNKVLWDIRYAPSAHEAFKIAERHKADRRPDWDVVKVDVMRRLIRFKADQHEYVRRKLLATGDRELVENSWRDDFWGWGPDRDGQNMLGKLWMELRSELRARSALSPQKGE